MKELIAMWKNTRMVALAAATASLYAAVLIPFKPIPIIPGFTEIRPANVIPIVCSFLFGPASCWGSAFGNLIGDFFGTLGLGSIFGFIGNFLYAYIPYKAWRIISRQEPAVNTLTGLTKYIFVVLLASCACAVVIGWGVDSLGFVPFSVLANIIFINNFLVASVLGPFLLVILYPRIKKWGLLYSDLVGESSRVRTLSGLGLGISVIGCIGGMGIGNIVSLYPRLLELGFLKQTIGCSGVLVAVAPAIFLILLGCILM